MLWMAIWNNDLTALGKLLEEEGIDADAQLPVWSPEHPTTLLSMAMVSKNLAAAEFLLDQGVRVDVKSTRVRTGGSPRAEDLEETYTPLMFAASTGFAEGARLLLERGADVDAPGRDGCTALIVAAAFNATDVGRALLRAKADVEETLQSTKCLSDFPMNNVTERRQEVRALPETSEATALWIAAAAGAEEMVGILVEAGADRSTTASCAEVRTAGANERKCTPERIATLMGRHGAAEILSKESQEVAGSVNARDLRSMSPSDLKIVLSDIMQRQDAAALEAYIAAGLRVNDVLPGHLTPLILACAARAPSLAQLLLENKAEPNQLVTITPIWKGWGDKSQCENVWSALLTAIEKDCEECVRLLLAGGVDPSDDGSRGVQCVETGSRVFTPLTWAVLCNKPAIVRRLLDAGADTDAIVHSTDRGNEAAADGATPLWIAAYNGSFEIADMLLKAGADLDAEAYCAMHSGAREKKCTARRIAELSGYTAIVLAIDEHLSRVQARKP